MKLKNFLIAVTDMELSKRFYRELFGLRVAADFGENVSDGRTGAAGANGMAILSRKERCRAGAATRNYILKKLSG